MVDGGERPGRVALKVEGVAGVRDHDPPVGAGAREVGAVIRAVSSSTSTGNVAASVSLRVCLVASPRAGGEVAGRQAAEAPAEQDNYAADRAAAEKVLTFLPEAPRASWDNRGFLQRAVRFLAMEGVRPFIDIGTGLPTQGHVHEIAQQAAARAGEDLRGPGGAEAHRPGPAGGGPRGRRAAFRLRRRGPARARRPAAHCWPRAATWSCRTPPGTAGRSWYPT